MPVTRIKSSRLKVNEDMDMQGYGVTNMRAATSSDEAVTFRQIIDSLVQTLEWTAPASDSTYIIVQLENAKVIAVVRNNILETNYTHDAEAGTITFPEGLQAGEKIFFVFYKILS